MRKLVRSFVSITLAAVAVACAANADPNGSATCKPGFPTGTFSPSAEADQMMADRLWAVLKLSHERALCETPGVVSQRLVVLPSFGRPRVLRIDRTDERLRLVWTQLDGRGGYELGKAVGHREKDVAGEEAESLSKDLGKLDALMRGRGGLGRTGSDGTVWLLESWISQRHDASAAWSPRGQLEDALREVLRAVGDQCPDCQ